MNLINIFTKTSISGMVAVTIIFSCLLPSAALADSKWGTLVWNNDTWYNPPVWTPDPDPTAWYKDADSDGYGAPGTPLMAVYQPSGYVSNDADCDDSTAAVCPGAAEISDDGIDQDCDGKDDVTWYLDADKDGFGDTGKSQVAVSQPPGYVADNSDCNDAEPGIYPGAPETAEDGIDQDCDGKDLKTWYLDTDLDGFGKAAKTIQANTQPTGYADNNEDCNNGNPDIYPGAPEIADDGIDQDCDGKDSKTWYPDGDNDGFGDPSAAQVAADQPQGYVSDNTDCNDWDKAVYPGAPETAGDLIDQDCDGKDAPLLFIGTLEAAPSSGLVPVTVQFTTLVAQGAPPFTFKYDFGDGSQPVPGANKMSHEYKTKGTYTAKVTVTDAAGASADLTVSIQVIDDKDLDDLKSQLIVDADQAGEVTQPDDLPGILSDARDIIDKTLTAVATADPKTKKEIEDTIRDEAGTLIDNTTARVVDFIAADQADQADIDNILTGIEDVVSNMVKNDVAVSGTTLGSLETLSGEAFSASVDTLFKDEGLASGQLDEIKTDDAKAKAYLAANPHLLEKVVDASGISVDVVVDFNAEDIEDIAFDQGLDEKQTAGLFNAIEPTPDVEKIVALGADATKTIAEIAVEIVDTYYSDKVLEDFTIEAVTKNLLLKFTDNNYISFLIADVSIVEDFLPLGLFFLPEGGIIGVKGSYSIKLIPYPVEPFGLTAELLKIGIKPKLTQAGTVNAELPGNGILSTGIGWGAYPGNTFNDMTTSFSVVGGSDPSAEAYSLLVSYDTGLSQLIPPAVFALDALIHIMNTLVPADYFIEQSTGVITIGDLNLKPDYVFTPKKDIDFNLIKAGGGFVFGKLGFELKDFNKDGLVDFGLYSDAPKGFQMLFSVPD